ncbi:LAMI_0E01068g1_1 [Lachancea mirantina]|uniref:LAMI_0E01068g1_1 n=1 Tax=Lachancea mirantina TaxID=1230905 RepID=A0A1G4JIC5_9SACH|nr:LAMI_0E01068g1_1 [Lachancea mirantina]
MVGNLHLWGFKGKPNLVSPESIALFWLLSSQKCNKKICIVFSNNTDLSPNGELPVLIEEGQSIYGYGNIAQYLFEQESALETALLEFAQTQICALTQYQLYLERENYEQFTRKVFAHLLQWPYWYNTPLRYRALARKKCEKLKYLSHPDDEESDENVAVEEMTQSSVLKLSSRAKSRGRELLADTRHSVQYLSELGEQLKTWLEARGRLNKEVIAADFLLWANLHVQLTLPRGQRIGDYLHEFLGAEAYQEIQEQLRRCDKLACSLDQRPPNFAENGNPLMSTYAAVQKVWSLYVV